MGRTAWGNNDTRLEPPALTVGSMLSSMQQAELDDYYNVLLRAIHESVSGSDTADGIAVVRIEGKGKGLVATRAWHTNDEILRERPYVAVQSPESSKQVLACANCFRFVGSVELQAAWRLLSAIDEESNIAGAPHVPPGVPRADLATYAEKLLSGELRFPFPHICTLPPAVLCQSGCGALYCSTKCCAEAWMQGHCLLCPRVPASTRAPLLSRIPETCPYVRPFDHAALTKFDHDRRTFGWLEEAVQRQADPIGAALADVQPGPLSASPQDPPSTSGHPAEALHSGASTSSHPHLSSSPGTCSPHSQLRRPLPLPPWVTTQTSAEACAQIVEYSMKLEMPTVILAAQVVATVLCVAQQCAWVLRGRPGSDMVAATGSAALLRAEKLLVAYGGAERVDDDTLFHACFMGAWLPMHAATKKPLIECTFPPAGVAPRDYERHVEVVVENCVRLYRGSMHDERATALFSPLVISNILGAFELNCLGITVESPVEDLAEEVKAARKRAAGGADTVQKRTLEEVHWLLSQLGTTDMPCDGSAFYALQSCINHDNDPNCSCQKDIDDRDGSAVVTAQRDIRAGEELCISYVGDISQYKPEELRTTLAEYGIPV